ncbi:MAG: DUF4433 domain-containing protein [Methylococcaceae bacterium]|nr:DUF4433 domain-containing protein [Methylococcaceae bacterium]
MNPAIYHFTHLDNFSKLIKTGSILCKNQMIAENQRYQSAAYEDIQNQRKAHPVPVLPYGTLHDYVPFYFCSRSPMLYSIKQGNLINIQMDKLVFLKSSVQTVIAVNKAFVFTDGHAIMDFSDYYNNVADLKNVSWEVVNAHYWNDFDDGRRLRQAEFLVHQFVEWQLIETIGVYSQQIKDEIMQKIQGLSHKPDVQIKSSWFF